MKRAGQQLELNEFNLKILPAFRRTTIVSCKMLSSNSLTELGLMVETWSSKYLNAKLAARYF